MEFNDGSVSAAEPGELIVSLGEPSFWMFLDFRLKPQCFLYSTRAKGERKEKGGSGQRDAKTVVSKPTYKASFMVGLLFWITLYAALTWTLPPVMSMEVLAGNVDIKHPKRIQNPSLFSTYSILKHESHHLMRCPAVS